MTQKEKDNYKLSLKLREDGVITSPGGPFKESDKKEIMDLITRSVFRFELFDEDTHGNYQIFKSQMVREIKGKTEKPFKKSRLIV